MTPRLFGGIEGSMHLLDTHIVQLRISFLIELDH